MKRTEKNNDIYSWKNVFKNFFADLLSIVFDPKDGSPDDGLYSDFPGADFEKAFIDEWSKKKYGEIWGFLILIIDLVVFIFARVWTFEKINLLIILVSLSFIISIFLIIRGISAEKPNKLSSKLKNNIGRNDPCPCGSGKKYKQCCGK